MDPEKYIDIIAAELGGLFQAQDRMRNKVHPFAPLPRPRTFYLTKGYSWPYVAVAVAAKETYWETVRSVNGYRDLSASNNKPLAEKIYEACKRQPRLILRALRRIQAATAWCDARTEGRKRQAEEILRQQKKSVEALEVEAAMQALGR